MPHTKRTRKDLPDPPKVGDLIYVYTSISIDHGWDDFQGGLCEVESVEWEEKTNGGDYSISVKERSDQGYYWSYLSTQQDKLAKEFAGKERGYEDPDPVECVDLGDDLNISLNAVRCVIARAPQELRDNLHKHGYNIHTADRGDAVRLMHSEFVTLLLGIHRGFDEAAEKIIKKGKHAHS